VRYAPDVGVITYGPFL